MNKSIAFIIVLALVVSITPVVDLSESREYYSVDSVFVKKIHPQLYSKLVSMSDNDVVEVVIRLKPLPEYLEKRIRGYYDLAKDTLKLWSSLTQSKIIKFIVENNGVVHNRFWIDNVIIVKVRVSLLKKIAYLEDVVWIFENFRVELPRDTVIVRVNSTQYVESWGIWRIQAPDAWSMGYTGEGVRIAVLDTGVDITHPALAGKMLSVIPGDPYYPGGWMEFDSYGNPVKSTPHDTHGHGTHCSGTALGGNTYNILIGVAPGATLMHGLVLPYGGGTFAQVIAGMEWTVDPYYLDTGGNRIYTNLPAHVVSMSWGAYDYYGNELLPAVKNMLLMNIIPIAAIGNGGEGTADNPGNIWGVFGIGATDIYDNVAWFSGGKVVYWPTPPVDWPFYDKYPIIYVKPDFSAPGVDIVSSLPGGWYAAWSGTSMATPHVAGIVALILQVTDWLHYNQPDTPEIVYEILVSTSLDYGSPSQDTRYGWGLVNAYNAIQKALEYVKKSGVEGFVKDSITQEPVPWASIYVEEIGRWYRVNASGYFKIPLDPGTYHLTFTAWGYYNKTIEVEVKVSNGTIIGWVYDLLYGVPIENAVVTVVELGVSTLTDSNGYFNLTVPPGGYTLVASKTGYNPSSQFVKVGENETVVVIFQLTPAGNGTIKGVVYDSQTMNPIANATVWVYHGGKIYNYTDINGVYELNVPAGIYTVYAYKTGYAFTYVENVYVYPNTVTYLDILLTPVELKVVIVGNVDYYTRPHLYEVISKLGYPTVEYDDLDKLLGDWANGLIYPKVIVIDHGKPDPYQLPSFDTLLKTLLYADIYGTSIIFLGTSYSGYTGIHILYAYSTMLELYGYPAPDRIYYDYWPPEYVKAVMYDPSNPIFSNVTPDDTNWFYLANIYASDWADYLIAYFDDDPVTVIGGIRDDFYGIEGPGVMIWYSYSGLPWIYLTSWAESWWMQYTEPGFDGVYSVNTMTVLLNAVKLCFEAVPSSLSHKALELLYGEKSDFVSTKQSFVKPNIYTYLEVYLDRLPHGYVKGTVIGSDGTVLAGAKITVLGTPVTTETDHQGRFRIWLPEGTYVLVISAPGYALTSIDVTVFSNVETDLGTIVLQRIPRVAVMWDFANAFTFLINAMGYYAKSYVDLAELNNDLATGFYDAVIYSGYYGVPFPLYDEFMKFINIVDTLGIGIIFMDSYGYYGYGIKVLSYYLGDPAGFGYTWGWGSVYISVDKKHPIFDGYNVGELVMINWWGGADFSWFFNFTGDVLGDVYTYNYYFGWTNWGNAIGVKLFNSGAKWILLSSFAITQWNTPDTFTTDYWIILINAINYAIIKPLVLVLENPYLHVGDTAVLYISNGEPYSRVSIYLNNILLDTIELDSEGKAAYSFTVPLIPGGEHVVSAISTDYKYYGYTKLYVLPKLVVIPTYMTAPGQICIEVTGLSPNQLFNIYLGGNLLTILRANKSGALTEYLIIPLINTGSYTIKLVDYSTLETLYNVTLNVVSELDTLENRLSELESKIEDITLELISIIGDIAILKNRTDIIAIRIDQLDAKIIAINETCILLNTSIGLVVARVDGLAANIEQLINKTNVLDSKIQVLGEKIKTLEDKDREINTSLSGVQSISTISLALAVIALIGSILLGFLKK